MRRAGELPNWSAKSNTTRARVQRSRLITWPSRVPLSLLLSGSAPRGSGKLEQDSVRFRQMTAALASTGQSLEKVKVLLEDIEREWPRQSSVVTAVPSSVIIGLNEQRNRRTRIALLQPRPWMGRSNWLLENAEC